MSRSCDNAQLIELNQRSFDAENTRSAQLLAPMLAEEFAIIRSTGRPPQDKQAMLDAVVAGVPGRLRYIDDDTFTVRRLGDTGIVMCRVRVEEPDGTTSGHYWNTKVFVNRDNGWQCIAWHVTRQSDDN